MGRRSKGRRGLFFFWDTMGLPIDMSILHLRTKRWLSNEEMVQLLIEFIEDAMTAGWKDEKIKGDLREADFCGHLNLKQWFPKLYEDRH